jgi:phage shock protein PspC (stress-responsive transcriptional regulator)
MKKTIPTTIAGTLFYIEEDAYIKLKDYLDSIKMHFSTHTESAEIISDIEARISEQLLENNKEKIVTEKDVEKIISSMGSAKDFGREENETRDIPKETHTARKLFRNPDNVIIGGVASGIAAYLGIDPIIVRLIFVLIVLAGGSGVLIYLILWLIIPMAKTASDKLEMSGRAVTIESVKDVFQEKVDEVKKNKGTFRKIITFPILAIGAILHYLVPVLKKIIGFVVAFATSVAMFSIVFVTAVTVFNLKSPYIDFPLLQMGHTAAIYILIIAGFFAAFIPVLFMFSLGVKLLSNRNILSTTSAISLVTLWFFALMSIGITASRVIPEYQNYIRDNPQYQGKYILDFKDFQCPKWTPR